MQPLIYDVAVSADGFIADTNGDASRFPHPGQWVDAYLARLATYGTAIMGRATYTFGYDFGMAPGDNPYPMMETHIISDSLKLPIGSVTIHPRAEARDQIRGLKSSADKPLYLCGGGRLAGWALSHGLIDRLRLKRAPIFLGSGVPLFSGAPAPFAATLTDQIAYPEGVIYQEWAL
ncbi:dihydrofolate reductase family protein [uncultured Maritimibacter sp.]|jgi:dihydrofolate reductase|uniref:dihydrofolate reductase family protein n=1 Tax=uncultured Maritimibacter sp. TaxID=991866 RepID=UPI002625D742|nr:dihydrofolate reductase family protein [uncultured Maritimibacter sp.]